MEWTTSMNEPYSANANPYRFADQQEELGSTDGRMLRGGSWFGRSAEVRCTHRLRYYPGRMNDLVGFRVVSPGPQKSLIFFIPEL